MRSLKLLFVSTLFRLLWTTQHKGKHEEQVATPQTAPFALRWELARVAPADWALTREALGRNMIGNGAESMEYVRRQIKAFKKR